MPRQNKKLKLVVILGPTASGKSELAVKLAKKFSGEIISADSRQVYKGMDIGTAKAVPAKLTQNKNAKQTQNIIQGVPHHLINVVFPNQEFNVAIYKKLAIKAIKDIQKRGKLPFLVGGTGLYIKAVVDNIEFPKVPPQKQLREDLEKKSAKELFQIYKKLDQEGTKLIEKNNKRRLIRAIEVCKVTGQSFWQQRKKGAKLLFDVLQVGIKLGKKKLRKEATKRVQGMFKLGLENEVKKLVKKYGWIPSLQTIGYQEWKDYFYPSPLKKGGGADGKINKNEVKNLIIQHTLQFARRQMTWFKRDKRIHWIKNYQEAEKFTKKFLLK